MKPMAKKKVYRYYDPNHVHLRTLQVHQRSRADMIQKYTTRVAVVLGFFVVEGVLMLAVASAHISASAKAETITGLKKPKNKVAAQPEAAPQLQQYPMYLVISKLLVNAPVEAVGVNDKGEMANPSNLQKVAWYKDGTKPGQKGSVVLAGHTGSPSEIGVLQGVDKLNEGDSLEVRETGGKTSKYQVYKTATYAVGDVPLPEVFAKDDGAYLNLISCVGKWNSNTNSYDQRLVVYTKLVSNQ